MTILPLRLRWGPYTCPQRRHRQPAEGVETTSWSSLSNMAVYRREQPQTELMTGNSGMISWKQRRSCRGMLHDDDFAKQTLQGTPRNYGEW